MKVKDIYICMKKFDNVRANGYNNDIANERAHVFIIILIKQT